MTVDRKAEVRDWLHRIDQFEVLLKEWETEWENNYKAVYGDDYMETEGKRSGKPSDSNSDKTKYSYDKCLAYLKTELPSLVLTVPEIFLSVTDTAKAEDPQVQAASKLIQGSVDTILADLDGLDIDTRCMLADLHCAYMVAKVVPIMQVDSNPMAGKIVGMNLDGTPIVEPPEELGEPSYDIFRVNPFKFRIDHRCKNNPRRAGWWGEQLDKTLQEIKTEKIYPQEVIDKLESKVKEKTKNKDLKDYDIELTLYEVYDRTSGNIIVICREYDDDFLRNEPMPDGIEYSPYVIRKQTEIPGQWFNKPEMSSGRIAQEDYKQGRELQKEAAKRANPQFGVKEAFATAFPDEVKRLTDGVSKYVKLSSQDDVFLVNKDVSKDMGSIDRHMLLCREDFNEVMGQTSQARGLVGDPKFATELDIAEAKGDERRYDKAVQVRQFWAMIIEKLLMLMEAHPAEKPEVKQALSMLNPDLDVQITVENRNPKSRAVERKQLIEAAEIFPPLQSSPTFVECILGTFESIRNKDQILNEVKANLQAQAQANAPQPAQQEPSIKGSASITFKGELLPMEAQDYILDQLLKGNVPMTAEVGVVPDNGGQPALNASPAEGTEGLNPEGGMG